MKAVSHVSLVVVAFALGACGSVQPGGTDASARGGGGGSTGGTGAQAGSGGSDGGTSVGGSGGGAGGSIGASGSGGAGRGGSGGQGGGGRSGTGGVGLACGAGICSVQDTCCGPAECPQCVMIIPGRSCPTTCGGAGGGSAGRGGASGSAGRGGTGGSAGRGGTGGGSGGAGGRVPCETDANCQGFKCCAGGCINPGNDILNCGTCGNTCGGAHPYCAGGTCQNGGLCALVGATCADPLACCGTQCCAGTQICCTVTLGPTVTSCVEPVNGTCPTGCANCNCAAPATPIATPTGDRPIAELKVGDLVYSLDHGALVIVPVRQVHRQPVTGSHRVVELKLAHGRTLRISPRHPTADGRRFSDLAAGAVLDGVRVISARLVDYDQPFTYDILPDSDSGSYFAAGTLIGSTLLDRTGDFNMTAPAATTSVRRASVLLDRP